MGKREWWEQYVPRISDAALEPQPRHGFWMSPQRYRFTHPKTGRTQDMVFPVNTDPDEIDRIVRDQERRALVDLSDPRPDNKTGRVSMSRRLTEIAGRETAVKERWY